MVSIMRPEQTLRLIQLYHANYPEIARNNQDADGRNLKLQMWAQITAELNALYDTQFTVEQFKKKVQNVQCTSRQKLYSGKRNLGEAEVEYLRLFESDKISEEMLILRAKNRSSSSAGAGSGSKSYSTSPHPTDLLVLSRERIGSECLPTDNDGSNAEEVDSLNGNANGDLVESSCQQLDSAQQFLLAMLNVTLGGIGMEGETGNGPIQPTQGQKKRKQEMTDENLEKRDTEPENGQPQPTAVPTKRSRKPDRPTRGIVGLGMEKPAEGEVGQKEAEVVEQIRDKAAGLESEKLDDEAKYRDSQQRQSPVRNEASSTDKTKLNGKPSEVEGTKKIEASSPSSIIPPNGIIPTDFEVPCQCECHKQTVNQMRLASPTASSLEQLCMRLEATNVTLGRIAELLAERLPMPTRSDG